MRLIEKRIVFLVVAFMVPFGLISQEYHGTTGLLQVPCAEMDSAGTFKGNISFVSKYMLPDMSYYGDGIPFDAPCYTIGISFFRWIEMSYTGTLVKIQPNGDKTRPLGYYNEDRHINVKLTPLYEWKWWPAIAIGWDDLGNLNTLKISERVTTNNFFENIYIAASKHFDIKGYEIGAHMVYRYYSSDNNNRERRGVAGGLTLRPAFYRALRFITEWDGIGVNVGADILLWKHWFAQVASVHGKGFSGVVGYHYRIPY